MTRAVADVLPQAKHRHCARHIYHAFNKKWKGQERKLDFLLCSRAPFKENLKDKLKDLSKLGKGIVEDVLTWLVERWCRAYQRTDIKCDVVDNNMAETFNGWILDSRQLTIVSMLEEIRLKVMRRIASKRQFVDT